MIRYALMVFLLGLTLMTSAPARAGIEDKLEDQFDTMVNFTAPSVHMGARRGVITGGSLSLRTPVVNIRPFSFRGPSISAGCGGIDAFFGSFSFISKEQLVQAMRAIVTAAISYAFQLALKAMCPSCADTLEKIQGWLNQANDFLTNSCEATRNAMDDWQISGAITEAFSNWRSDSGSVEDPKAAKSQGDTKNVNKRAVEESNKRVLAEVPAAGNQVWTILQKSGEASFGFGANDFFEEIMSMTGTVIVCVPGSDSCAEEGLLDGEHVGQEGELVIFRKPAVMTLTSLVTGAAAEPKQYKCNESDDCLKPTIQSNPIEGMAQKIRVAYLGSAGTNNTGGEQGILTKLRFNYSAEPTEEEIKWMKVGGSLTAMTFRLARSDIGAARGFVQDNAEAIAAEIVVGYIDKYMLSAQISAGRVENKGMKEAYDLIMQASARAHDEANVFYADAAKKSAQYQAYNARLEALQK